MDNLQRGIVVEVVGDLARVRASRHSHCENCGACPGNTAMIIEASNPVNALPGQLVELEIKEVNMLKAAFIVYIMPLVAAFAGGVAGAMLADQLGGPALWFETGGVLAAVLLSVLYIKYFDRNARSSDKMRPSIIRIISD